MPHNAPACTDVQIFSQLLFYNIINKREIGATLETSVPSVQNQKSTSKNN
jgi:hypothetical protein